MFRRVFPLLLLALLFVGCNEPESPELIISTEDTVDTGYTTILVESSTELRDLSVSVGGNSARLEKKEGNRFFFKYFVSPYTSRDPLGKLKVNAIGFDLSGNKLTNSSFVMVDYFARGMNSSGVFFYYLAEPPSPENPNPVYPKVRSRVLSILTKEEKVNFLVELDEGESDRNTQLIVDFQPVLVELFVNDLNVSYYIVEVREGVWVNCFNENSTSIDPETCKGFLNGSSVLLKLPDFPTTQTFIHEDVIELQPSEGETPLVASAFVNLLKYEVPWRIRKDN